MVQYSASFLASGGVNGVCGQDYWMWWSGEGRLFIFFELHFDQVHRTYRCAEKTLETNLMLSGHKRLAAIQPF